MATIKYYVTKPMDEYGNTGYPKAILKCEITEERHPKLGDKIRVLSPPEFANKWPSLISLFFIRLSGSQRPRMLEDKEWAIIVGFKR